MHQRRIIPFCIAVFILFSYPLLASAQRNNIKFNFKPEIVAKLEVQMWQAYYAGEYTELFTSLNRLQRQQFGLKPWQSLRASYYATRAAVAFRRLPIKTSAKEYEQKVLPHLTQLFSYLKQISHSQWDSSSVASAELQWWLTRRGPKGKNTQLIGQQIAKVYSLLCQTSNSDLSHAGYLRAKAANLRDQQGVTGSVNWNAVYQLLLKSYRALKQGC